MEAANTASIKKFIPKEKSIEWDYDGEADVLYISFGAPRPAVGVDMGNSVIMRYDEKHDEIVGITIIGVRASARYQGGRTSHTEGITTTKAAPDPRGVVTVPKKVRDPDKGLGLDIFPEVVRS